MTTSPAASTPLSADWLDQQIAEQTALVEMWNARVTATDVYQRLQQEIGVLNWLLAKKAQP